MNNSKDLPTTPEQLFALFNRLGIGYALHRHAPVFKVEDSKGIDSSIADLGCRNLFLRDNKEQMFLVVLPHLKPLDLKVLAAKLGCGRLSFGSPERLMQYLGIYPGAVCPFALVNDSARAVRVVLDAAMMRAERVAYHPLDNAMTVELSPADLLKFFAHTGHEPTVLEF